jgi:hypothetical protein
MRSKEILKGMLTHRRITIIFVLKDFFEDFGHGGLIIYVCDAKT